MRQMQPPPGGRRSDGRSRPIAKAVAASVLHGTEARGAEALVKRVEPNLPYPPRTDLTTDAYHGTRRVFNEFMPWTFDEAGSMDRALGTHAAKDPAMSSEAFALPGGPPRDYHKMGAQEYENLAEKPHVIPLKIPDERTFLQAVQPQVRTPMGNEPYWKTVRSDTSAIEDMISRETFMRNPDTLAEYLQRGRAFKEPDARAVSRALVQGESVPMESGGKAYDLPGLISNYFARPYDQQHAVDTARGIWQDQGYKGIRYVNTAPMEAGAKGVVDPTSYIVFSPSDIRSRFAKFAGDPASVMSPDLMRGVAAAPVAGAMSGMFDPSQYEAAP